jgi:hypothetical protein
VELAYAFAIDDGDRLRHGHLPDDNRPVSLGVSWMLEGPTLARGDPAMGFIKQAKSDAVAKEAQRAIEEGRTVFAPRLNTPMTHPGLSGSIPGWAEMIEAIEAAGWTMVDWSVSTDQKGRPEAYPLFRRR